MGAAVVTLGNMLLPVLVTHIRPLCYRCQELHFPLTPAEKLSTICDAFFISGNFISYLFCFVWPIHQTVVLFLRLKKKKEKRKGERQWEEIFMNVNCGCGRSPWSVTNLCPVVLLWPLRDIWMYVWVPGSVLFSRPVLYVHFLILSCTSGKHLPSIPRYVPQ